MVFVEGSLQNATKYPLLNARLFEIQNLTDWSAEMCEDITVEDFDESAVNLFVSDYKKNHIQNQNISDIQIFEKLGILIDGKVTNSGALLLCKEEFANKVSFGQYARIQCIYDYSKIKDLSNPETGKRDRENYTIPLYPKIFKTIEFINRHNEPIAQTNIFRDGERQYDEILLRELILNAITHRDWSVCEPSPYIQILQNPDGITISNVGEYKFKDLLTLATLPNINKFYRNPLLSNLFRMIGLVDQEGGGIIDKIIPSQKKKGFPLPIYTKKDGLTVAKIEVKILDLKFAELIQNVDMEIRDLVLLDKIARGKNKLAVDIEREDFKKLKSKGYVVAGKGKHPVIEINTKFAEQNNITGYKLKFQKYNKGKEEEIILNLLKQHEKRKMSEFEQLFEDRHYTLDMVYNIIRRLKLKKLVTRDTKNLWSLTSDLTTINLLNEKII